MKGGGLSTIYTERNYCCWKRLAVHWGAATMDYGVGPTGAVRGVMGKAALPSRAAATACPSS